ncbi:MAG: hypothetical protein WA060_00245 [Minisyncoccia bacterium]
MNDDQNDSPFPQKILWCDSDIGALKEIGKGEGNLTEEQLKEVLRRYNLRDGLIALGQVSNLAFNNNGKYRVGRSAFRDSNTGVFVTEFALAYLANVLIASGANDYKSKQINNKQNLLTLLNIYSNDLVAPELVRDRSVTFTHKDMLSTMVRMHFEQFEYQFDYLHLVARNLIIFNEIIDLVIPRKFESLKIIFERETGLTFQHYFFLVMAVWAVSQKTATFRKEALTEAIIPSMQSSLTDEKVTNFLNILSADYKTFREVDNNANMNMESVFTKYRFNPLLIYPVIKTDKGSTDPYVIPNTLSFFKRGFGGLYWWFHRHFEIDNTHKNFRDYFGEVFEMYVGRILKQAYGTANVHPEIIYSKDKKKFIDWWVEHKSTIYLFEVKSYQFALPTKQTGDLELILKEVKSKIIESIEQVYKRMSEIEKYDELAIFRGRKIVPLIVFMEIPLISGQLYKEMIAEELEHLEKNGLVGIKNAKIHLLNIEELELYTDVMDKIPLEEVFAKYENNLADGFLSIIQKEIGKKPVNKYLDGVYKDFWKDMSGGTIPLEGDEK